VQREVQALAAAGIVRSRRAGQHVYYQANEACPYLPELRDLVIKIRSPHRADLAETAAQPVEPIAPIEADREPSEHSTWQSVVDL
jgi:hypothetical protein